jgi:hypothetical protein
MRQGSISRAPFAVVCAAVLGAVLIALAVWRGWCVLSGPDIDTDAYAHHMIARAILADPRDLGVHWVWLPLFHYAQVPLVALGGTMETVRWTNVLLSAALPVVLFFYVRRTSRADGALPPDAIALLAALIAGACPIVMQMGTTAQPEPLFALLVLGVAIAFQERRYVATSVMLGAAVMLRYEAWAALLMVTGILAVEPWMQRLIARMPPGRGIGHHETIARMPEGLRPERTTEPEPRSLVRWVTIVPAVVLILGWAVLRRPVDGRWFGFLRDTKSFANDALHETSALDRGLLILARDILYYPLFVPIRVLGLVVPLVPFGVVRTLRAQGARFVLMFVACLGFVSFTWVMRSSLGLDRHFVCIVPLYATFAAQGVAAIADVGRRRKEAGGQVPRLVRWGLGTAVAATALVGLGLHLEMWMDHWRGSIVHSWPDRRAVGAYLRALPGTPTVFCDDATVEILSGLDRRRFDRHWMDDPHSWDVVADDARASGAPVYVATWRRKLKGHESAGEIVLRAVEPGVDPSRDDIGLAVMRVPPTPLAGP